MVLCMMKRLNVVVLLVALFAAVVISGGAHAQGVAYPVKPIRVLVPFPPGGTPDIHIRFVSDRLLARLGQPLVVDNRAGASGNIAMETAARAQPDGYTLIIGTVGNWAVNPHLFKLNYDVLRDFSPVVQIATTPAVLVVHPSVPVHSVKELVALTAKTPGALNYGSSGVGGFGHMCAELFSAMTKTRMTHVPYKGAALALTELTGGHIQVLFNSAAMTLPHIRTGRVRGLATTGATRFAAMSELPTVAEAGVPGYENTTWSLVSGPAKMLPAIVERLNAEFNAILREPDIRERFAGAGSTVTGTSARQAADILKTELAKFGRLVREANIPPATGGY